jgi:glycosyltransferase involved in cell wall biosynthesis
VKLRPAEKRASGVSFVVPVRNGAPFLRETFQAIFAQADGRPMEVIAVDDRSTDGSSQILRQLTAISPIRIVPGEGRGAAAAINAGIRTARHPIVCQVDQDVAVGPGWMALLLEALGDPDVAAAQGYYVTDRSANIYARVTGFDLEQRYAAIAGRDTDHVCTGNSAYRVAALREAGLFDEHLGYGYDNDISYRLRDAGYRLVLCRAAKSVHRWREGFVGYCTQQYGFGYGRIDVVAKRPRRVIGDSVSPASMMAHPTAAGAAAGALMVGVLMMLAGANGRPIAGSALLILLALATERFVAGVRAALRFRAWTPLLFPIVHLVRDLVWVAAISVWSARRVRGRTTTPIDSMKPRSRAATSGSGERSLKHEPALRSGQFRRTWCLIPAHNEARNLPAVIDDVRTACPGLDILVVDDGSTDATSAVAQRQGVRWIRLPERMGIGSAMRAGLRYATRFGCDAVVRIDGDGQHRGGDIPRVLDPILNGHADVVLGSRYVASASTGRGLVGLLQRSLGACLSILTGRRVTDPTSGFCALGPRAVRLLAEHHPTGYAEAELRLFMSRNALNVIETPVGARSRLSGRTSLTPRRLAAAAARVLLAMVIVPLRCAVRGAGDD